MKKRGQLFLFIALAIIIVLIIVIVVLLQVRSDREHLSQFGSPQFNDVVISSFYASVTTCLQSYSERFITAVGSDSEGLGEFLRVSGSVCINESQYPELSIRTNPPLLVSIQDSPDAYFVEVTLDTEIHKESTNTIITTYSFIVPKEVSVSEEPRVTNETDSEESEPVVFIDIAIDDVMFLRKNHTATNEVIEEVIISYTNITENTTAYDALLSELPIIDRRFFYSDEELADYYFEKALYEVLLDRGFDEIITYNAQNISFEELKELLLVFPFVENVSRNNEYTLSQYHKIYRINTQEHSQNDQYYDYQWYLENKGQFFGKEGADININDAWHITKGNNDVTIAIIDQGIARNEDYEDSILYERSYNYLNKNKVITPQSIYEYHGTHVAGVIASSVDNDIGIAGVCPNCSIISMRVFNARGSASSEDVIKAAFDSVKAGADIISMSLGGTKYSQYEESMFQRLTNQGIFVIAAAGNEGSSEKTYPAAYNGVIGVGATNNRDGLAYFSNYGDWVTIYAPGENILSFCNTNTYCFDSGTSMATPLVSGVVGLLLSYDPTLGINDVVSILQKNADSIDSGRKRMNAGNALQSIYEDTIESSPTPETLLNETAALTLYESVIAQRNLWVTRRENVSIIVPQQTVESIFSNPSDFSTILHYCNEHYEDCVTYCAQTSEELFICRLI